MEQYNVTGMSCAACSARVEKAVSKVPGVNSCSVSLLTNSMGVEGTASSGEIIAAVEAAGYGASLKGGAAGAKISMSAAEEALEDHETPILKRRLITSVGFLLVLMYFSMGHMMWGWPLPKWFDGNHVAMGLVQLLLAGIIMVINQKFFINGFKSLWRRSPNMDTLVALGSMASFLWSVYALFAMTRAQVDGVILEGTTAVNESALTGESIPVDKETGDMVSAATVNQSGFIKCEATRVGEDTTLSQIIKMVSDAAATKAPIAKIADRVSGVFVPAVITIAVITTIIWLLAGQTFGYALARGISVLVISCPCALGLATPVAIMVGNGMGAKNGILFKTAVSLEEAGKVQIVALDKTGTITSGQPEVTDILPAEGVTETELLTLACALEKKSEHPLAKAVLKKAEEENLATGEVTGFQALPGNGLSAILGSDKLTGGSMKFISSQTKVSAALNRRAEQLAEQGKTPLLFTRNGKLLGIIAVADVIKEDSPRAVKELQNMGIRVVMLTGDNERTAKAIGAQAGVDDVIAGVLPDGKESVIRALKEQGKVAMVGDGINDAPALTRADIGIAIGAGTDIAIDAADIVLMKSQLSDVPAAVRLSRATLRNIHENLFWAFFYNIIGIPLAAGVWIPLFGWTLNPMFGAAAMSLSSFCVVTNALRLNLFQIHNAAKDKEIKNPVTLHISHDENIKEEKENKTMVKVTVNVEGMMCGHCEAHVNKAIQAAFGAEDVVSSHENGTTVFSVPEKVDEAKVEEVIKEAGYEFKGITQE